VIVPLDKKISSNMIDKAYTEAGYLINSEGFDNLFSEEAKEHITKALEEKKLGMKAVNYKIRDWMISRQRYWGTPIPVIYCGKCGIIPVPEKELPVKLPEKADFKSGAANPLSADKEFLSARCPKCGGKGRRESDTMGGFVDSSWYFLRYCDSRNKSKPFDKTKADYWMPVDQYVGGAEHAVMHLIYARFFTKVLKDLGLISFDEPFKKLFNQGIVYKDGVKMSKSKGNVVFQTDISNKYGIDTARLFLMFVSSPDKQMEWSDDGVEGAYRIINKIVKLKDKIREKADEKEESKINSLVKKVSDNIESFDYPKAIVPIFEAVNYFSERGLSKESYFILLKLISPFCPHSAEEMWERTGGKGFVSLAEWPKADESKINENFEKAEKAIEKIKNDIINIKNISGLDKPITYIYPIPSEVSIYEENKDYLANATSSYAIMVYGANDKTRHDPQGKAGKAKPGKPGIYLEPAGAQPPKM
jgi:leucyl-tRNA synthetase